jgi:enediyne polyketide synthase
LSALAPSQGVPAVLEDGAALYGDLFFHRGRFARVLRYHELHSDGCLVDIACRDEAFFGAFQPTRLCLGDPGARDAAIHALQACVPDRDLLPIGVRRIAAGRLGGCALLRVRAVERSRREAT